MINNDFTSCEITHYYMTLILTYYPFKSDDITDNG